MEARYLGKKKEKKPPTNNIEYSDALESTVLNSGPESALTVLGVVAVGSGPPLPIRLEDQWLCRTCIDSSLALTTTPYHTAPPDAIPQRGTLPARRADSSVLQDCMKAGMDNAAKPHNELHFGRKLIIHQLVRIINTCTPIFYLSFPFLPYNAWSHLSHSFQGQPENVILSSRS